MFKRTRQGLLWGQGKGFKWLSLSYVLISQHNIGNKLISVNTYCSFHMVSRPVMCGRGGSYSARSFLRSSLLPTPGGQVTRFKGTVSRDGFGFWWHLWLVQGLLKGDRAIFLYVLAAQMGSQVACFKDLFAYMTKTWDNLHVRAHRCPLWDALVSALQKNGEIVAKNLISYL